MKIYYEVVGVGYPIVCLHGNGENHHIFDEFVRTMMKDYQLILIDSRYHGKSIHEGELSYEQFRDDVMSVIDELNISEYDVVGFSDGAIVSFLLALKDKRLKHIVSLGANTKPNMIKSIYRLTIYTTLFCLIPFCLYNKQARLSFKLNKLMLKQPNLEYEMLKDIRIPVLVMAGQYDMIKEEDTLNIGQSLPYSVTKIIKGGNHFLLRDSFNETMKEIRLFLYACHRED